MCRKKWCIQYLTRQRPVTHVSHVKTQRCDISERSICCVSDADASRRIHFLYPNRFSQQGKNTVTPLSRISLTLLRIVLKQHLPTNLSLLILNQVVIVRFNNYEYNKTVLFGNIRTVTVIVLTILLRKSKHCSFLYNFHLFCTISYSTSNSWQFQIAVCVFRSVKVLWINKCPHHIF